MIIKSEGLFDRTPCYVGLLTRFLLMLINSFEWRLSIFEGIIYDVVVRVHYILMKLTACSAQISTYSHINKDEKQPDLHISVWKGIETC